MAIRSWKAGWGASDTIGDFRHLGFSGTITGGNCQTLQSQDGSAQVGANYQVAAGKTLYLLYLIFSGGGASYQIQLGYSPGAAANIALPANARLFPGLYNAPTTNTDVTFYINMPITQNNYPLVYAASGASPMVKVMAMEF
jgi:hypothetical protein